MDKFTAVSCFHVTYHFTGFHASLYTHDDMESELKSGAGHYSLPNPLTEYLYGGQPHIIRDLNTLSITLGPWDSYYAHDKTTASWSNLPPPLEKALEHRLVSQDKLKTTWKDDGRDAPSFVTLGADGSYFMRTVKGGGSWDLKAKEKEEGMKGTNKFLEDSPDFNGVAVCISFPVSSSYQAKANPRPRAYTSSLTTPHPTFSSSQTARPFPTSQKTPGTTTTKWLPRCQPSSSLCHPSPASPKPVPRPNPHPHNPNNNPSNPPTQSPSKPSPPAPPQAPTTTACSSPSQAPGATTTPPSPPPPSSPPTVAHRKLPLAVVPQAGITTGS